MADRGKGEISKAVKNPLLSGAGVGFPFENFAGTSLLLPVARETPSVLLEDVGEVDTFVGQEAPPTQELIVEDIKTSHSQQERPSSATQKYTKLISSLLWSSEPEDISSKPPQPVDNLSSVNSTPRSHSPFVHVPSVLSYSPALFVPEEKPIEPSLVTESALRNLPTLVSSSRCPTDNQPVPSVASLAPNQQATLYFSNISSSDSFQQSPTTYGIKLLQQPTTVPLFTPVSQESPTLLTGNLISSTDTAESTSSSNDSIVADLQNRFSSTDISANIPLSETESHHVISHQATESFFTTREDESSNNGQHYFVSDSVKRTFPPDISRGYQESFGVIGQPLQLKEEELPPDSDPKPIYGVPLQGFGQLPSSGVPQSSKEIQSSQKEVSCESNLNKNLAENSVTYFQNLNSSQEATQQNFSTDPSIKNSEFSKPPQYGFNQSYFSSVSGSSQQPGPSVPQSGVSSFFDQPSVQDFGSAFNSPISSTPLQPPSVPLNQFEPTVSSHVAPTAVKHSSVQGFASAFSPPVSTAPYQVPSAPVPDFGSAFNSPILTSPHQTPSVPVQDFGAATPAPPTSAPAQETRGLAIGTTHQSKEVVDAQFPSTDSDNLQTTHLFQLPKSDLASPQQQHPVPTIPVSSFVSNLASPAPVQQQKDLVHPPIGPAKYRLGSQRRPVYAPVPGLASTSTTASSILPQLVSSAAPHNLFNPLGGPTTQLPTASPIQEAGDPPASQNLFNPLGGPPPFNSSALPTSSPINPPAPQKLFNPLSEPTTQLPTSSPIQQTGDPPAPQNLFNPPPFNSSALPISSPIQQTIDPSAPQNLFNPLGGPTAQATLPPFNSSPLPTSPASQQLIDTQFTPFFNSELPPSPPSQQLNYPPVLSQPPFASFHNSLSGPSPATQQTRIPPALSQPPFAPFHNTILPRQQIVGPPAFSPQTTFPPPSAQEPISSFFTPIPAVSSPVSFFNPNLTQNSVGSELGTVPLETFTMASPSGDDGLLNTVDLSAPSPSRRSPSPSVVPQKLLNLGQSGIIYRPPYFHWFWNNDVEEKESWQPFSMTDSLELEQAYNSESLTIDTTVATDGGRYDVAVVSRRRDAVYWQERSWDVRRCSWFHYYSTEAKQRPYDENTAALLEEEYKLAVTSASWDRRVQIDESGEHVIIYGPSSIAHFVPEIPSPDAWDASTDLGNQRKRAQIVKRGVEDFDIDDGESPVIDHLVFVVHGIGPICDLKFRSIEEAVGDFRLIAQQLTKTHYHTSLERGEVNRIELLPVSWHKNLHGDSGVDEKLKKITLKTIPKLREFTNNTLLDILFYTSPTYCQNISEQVVHEINRLHALFIKRNPSFQGHVSLTGHSLGSLILFDTLCHQKVAKSKDDSSSQMTCDENLTDAVHRPLTRTGSYVVGTAGTGQPFITYPQLNFQPNSLFALGSPIGMFVTVRGIDSLGLDFRLPTCPGFYNIFHPCDPVAYRIEALINPELANQRPILIPHHKGRKRMHLELRDTMARIGADFKQRLIDSMKTTWNTVNQIAMFGRNYEGLEQEVKAIDADRTRTESVSEDDNSAAAGINVGVINQGRRVDYVLQEAPFESFNEYLSAIISHVCYWKSEDTVLFIMKDIYNNMGITADTPSAAADEPMPSTTTHPLSPLSSSPSVSTPMGMDPTVPMNTPSNLLPPPTTGFSRK